LDQLATSLLLESEVVDYRQSTMTRFGGKTENPSMHK